jgi:hypothetical protein
MSWLVAALLLLLAALPASAQEPTLEAVAARTLSAQTYCERGKVSRRFDKQSPLQEMPFERCSHRDGRFRIVEENVVNWSDGKSTHHRFFRYNKLYQQHSLDADDGVTYGLYRNRSEIVAVVRLRHFVNDPRELTEAGRRTKYLQAFKPNAALSNDKQQVFERIDPYYRSTVERVWVRNSDKAMVRYELLNGELLMRSTEVAAAEFDRPLGAAELTFDVPLYARVSPQGNLPAFLALLFAAIALMSVLLWTWIYLRSEDPDALAMHRRRLWRFQRWAWLIVAVLLGILAAVSWGGSGHPPAIVYVFVLAVWAAVIFGLFAVFTLASYPVQWLLAKRSA